MKHIIIYENFTTGVFEQEKLALEGVVLISASTSDTNIQDALAKKMGVKKDTKYKITIKGGLDPLRGLSAQFPIFDLAEKKKSVMTITEEGKVPAGKDIFKINDKSIDEKGKITLKKSELSGKDVVIEASNNGILILYRIAGKYGKETNEKGEEIMRNDGITGFYKTSGLTLDQAADYIVNVEMGTSDQRKNQYAGAWSKSGNSSVSNTFLALVCSGVVIKAGGKILDQGSKKYDVVKKNSRDTKEIADSINSSLALIQKSMITRKFMVNRTPIDMKTDIEGFVSDESNYTKKENNVLFTKAGASKLLDLRNKFIDFICRASKIEGFPEETSQLLPKASEIMKKTFGTAGSKTAENWIQFVQREQQYAQAGAPSGNQGMNTLDFKEGGF